MESRTKVVISFVILIGLIGGMYLFTDWFSKVTGYALGEDKKVKLAQCLSAKNVVLYVSSTCIECDDQIKMFEGESLKYINIVECNSVEDCEGVNGVPAWKINKVFHYGGKSLRELIDLSGCEVE